MITKHFLWMMKSFCLSVTSALALPEKQFQHSERTTHTEVPGSTQSFDRDWRFARFGLQPDGSTLPEPSPAPSDSAYDDSRWRALDLPHDWGIEGPFRKDLDGLTGKLPWRGIGWYRKQFPLPASQKGQRAYLDFDGAMAHAEVWVNGHKAGGHPYGYTSFRADLTPCALGRQ